MLPINTVYYVNADGTSTIDVTPVNPLLPNSYTLHVDPAQFTDLAGNPATDPNQGDDTFSIAGPPNAPQLTAQSDTGVSPSDGLTRDNDSTGAPLTFIVSGVQPTNDSVQLYVNGNPVGSPVQAEGGAATITLGSGANLPLVDGTYQVAAVTTSGNTSSGFSATTTITVQTGLTITGTDPGDGSVVGDKLPNNQFVVTFSHPLAFLSDGQSPIQLPSGPNPPPFNPYDVFLLARGPDLTFTAPSPGVLNGGDLPLHADVVYHVNSDGSSEFVITPTEPMSTDVFALSVNLAAFSDLAGNPLTDPLGAAPGYRTFLFQKSAVSSQPLAVVGVTEYNGSIPVTGAVVQPDTISIQFNKPLFVGAAGNGNVQLIANPGPNFTVVPSVAAYSPTTDSIELTPTASLFPGTQYAVRVAGKDSPTTPSYVSDDQGFGSPDSNGALPHTVFDLFTVKNAPAGAGSSPLTVAVDAQGNPKLLPLATNNNAWGQAIGYVSAQFTEPLDPTSLGRYSAMFIPWKGGLNDSTADAGDVPLNATIAFNPNTNQLILVPSQPVGSGVYVDSLSSMKAMNTDPLMNDVGQAAGVSGGSLLSFVLRAARRESQTQQSLTGTHAADLVAAAVVSAPVAGQYDQVVAPNTTAGKPRNVVLRLRPGADPESDSGDRTTS